MRNGKLVSVDEMDTNHIKNAFKYLIKKHEQLVKDVNVMEDIELEEDLASIADREEESKYLQ